MSKLARAIRGLKFDADDARAMEEKIRELDAYIETTRTEFPAPCLLDYTPILGLALLKSQATLGKLTRWIISLTCFLGVLTIVQIALLLFNNLFQRATP